MGDVLESRHAQNMHDGRPVFSYHVLAFGHMALEDELVDPGLGRNDEPLSGMFGAPLRPRCETSHGYKMIGYHVDPSLQRVSVTRMAPAKTPGLRRRESARLTHASAAR